MDCLGDPAVINLSRRASDALQGIESPSYSKFDIENGYAEKKPTPARHSSFFPTAMTHSSIGVKSSSHRCCSSNKNGNDPVDMGATTVSHILSTLHRGSQSYHAQGICTQGGGTWSNDRPTVWSSGRESGRTIWNCALITRGGIYDSCNCDESGGLF